MSTLAKKTKYTYGFVCYGLFFVCVGFVVSVLILQLVHERVPDKSEDPPLPDVFFDVIPKRVEWAFDVCEAAGMVLVFILGIMAIFHRHR